MARARYGGVAATTVDRNGNLVALGDVYTWRTETTTTQEVDLVPQSGMTVAQDNHLISGPAGQVVFDGPDGYTGDLYISTTMTGARYRLSGPSASAGTASTTPTGTAGGFLSGTYPNPGVSTSALDTAVSARVIDTSSATYEALQDFLALTLRPGANTTLTYDDTVGTLTIAATVTTSGGSGGVPTGTAGGFLSGTYPNPGVSTSALDAAVSARVIDTTSATYEAVQDAMNATLKAGANTTLTYDETAGTLTIASTANGGGGAPSGTAGGFLSGTYPNPGVSTSALDTAVSARVIDTTSATYEALQDAMNATLKAGANTTLTYNDTANTLTIAGTPSPLLQFYTVGRSYYPQQYYGNSGTTASAESDLVCTPIVISNRQHFDALTTRLYAAGTTGALLRLGLYADTGSESPGSLLADGGTVDGTSVSTVTATINVTLDPGLYWIACAWQNTGTAPTTRASVVGSRGLVAGRGVWDRRASDPGYWLPLMSTVTGALPATFTESTQWHTPLRIGLRAAA